MGRCKGCKFWGIKGNNDYVWIKTDDHKCCGSGMMIYDYRFTSGTQVPIDGLGYTDGETYQAALWTGAEFGCIHYKGESDNGE